MFAAMTASIWSRRGKSFPTSSRHPPRTRGARGPSPGPALLSAPRSCPAAVRTPTARVDGENRGGSDCCSAHVKDDASGGGAPTPGWTGRRTRVPARRGERREAPIPSAIDPGKPSRHGPWRPGRSYSGALHLDARTRARSTYVWVDGRRDGSQGQWWADQADHRSRRLSSGENQTRPANLVHLQLASCLNQRSFGALMEFVGKARLAGDHRHPSLRAVVRVGHRPEHDFARRDHKS